LKAPVLENGLEFYLQAFFDLSSDRSRGFDQGPIPWSSIISYASHYGLDYEETEELLFFVRRLDNEYLKKANSKNG
jgi:hypothetical protein